MIDLEELEKDLSRVEGKSLNGIRLRTQIATAQQLKRIADKLEEVVDKRVLHVKAYTE